MIDNFPEETNQLKHYMLVDGISFVEHFFHNFGTDEQTIEFFLDVVHFTK